MRDRNKLFILAPDFENPAYPRKRFYCWHCALMEGLLASFPSLANQVDVVRIAWPKPRTELVKVLGLDNQSVPVLVFAKRPSQDIEHKEHKGIHFIDDKDAILRAFTLLYEIPHPHP